MKNIKYIFIVLILSIYVDSIAANLFYETTYPLNEAPRILEILGLQDYPHIFNSTDILRTIEELQREGYSILPFQELPLHIQKLKNFLKEILILKSISESEVESGLKPEFKELKDELRNLSYIFANIINSQISSPLEFIKPLDTSIISETHNSSYLKCFNNRYMKIRNPLNKINWHTHSNYITIIPIIEPNTLLKINEWEQSILPHMVFLFRGDILHSSPIESCIFRSFIVFRFEYD